MHSFGHYIFMWAIRCWSGSPIVKHFLQLTKNVFLEFGSWSHNSGPGWPKIPITLSTRL